MHAITSPFCNQCAMQKDCTPDARPVLGACSIRMPDMRPNAIRIIERRLRKEKSLSLRRSVTVTGDFLGCPYEVTVRRIAYSPVRRRGVPEFLAGPDQYGEMISSASLSSSDINKILNNI